MIIRTARPDDAVVVARLHAECIPEGFLASLGPRFLRRLYRRAVRSGRVAVLVAVTDDGADGAAGGEVAGFVAIADDVRAFYREFLARDWFFALVAAMIPVLRAPRSVFETLRYGGRAGGGESGPTAEILALAVTPAARGRGTGAALAAAALAEARRRGCPRVRVLTAVGNDAAVRAYERAGLRRAGRDSVHRGVEQDVLVWP